MGRKKYTWGGHIYLIADEDLKLYPGAEPVEDEKKVKKSSRPTKADPAAELTNPELQEEKAIEEAEVEKKAAEEPKNKARKSVKNKTKVEE